ncbi:unnamed protein product [Microthlaspi erraticum]|uniref:Uncharacterized protein n=1 Tax=Microthlaspi erraticum TaxID=1685480 RepID=A0A6D2KKL8_9BRAS|nr:unnamed protein product [Microthlaspi erraticum]
MFRARPNLVRPSEVSAKVQTVGRSRNHDPGNIARGRPRHATTAHDQSARAGRTPRGRATLRVPRPMRRPSRETTSRVRPRFHRPNSSVRPQRPTTHPSDPTVPTRPHTRLSGRSSRTTVPTPRSTRSPF